MKQAILLLIHKNLKDAIRLCDYFKGSCDIFIHIDKDLEVSKDEYALLVHQSGVVDVFQKYKVHWGAFSILKAERFLLDIAIRKSDFEYVHLLSGQDYPIKPLSEFLDFFATANLEYLQHTHLPHPNWDSNTMQRLQYYFFMDHLVVKQDLDVKKSWKLGISLAKYGIKRRVPDEFMHLYGGSQWFSLSREAIKAMLIYTKKHRSFYRRMRFVYCPDEIYFTTVLMNISYPGKREIVNNNLRFIKWPFTNAQHPKEIEWNDLRHLAASNAFFARKFGDISDDLKESIDQYFLSEEKPEYLPNGIIHTRSLSIYQFDEELARQIVYICHILNLSTAIDLGCGAGLYVDCLNQHHIKTLGYDGNKYTAELYQVITQESREECMKLEIHKPIKGVSPADIVLLISVGEYIPARFQDIVIENACKLAKKYLLISWANVFGTDIYVQNPIKKREMERLLLAQGFELDILTSESLRNTVRNAEHKNVYLFKRKDPPLIDRMLKL